MILLLLIYILLFSIMYFMNDKAKYRRVFPWVKLSTSIGFIAIATFSAVLSGQYPLYLMMLPAFLLAAAGDFLLGLASAKQDYYCKEFLIGIGAFLTAHVVFYIAFTTLVPLHLVDFIFPVLFLGLMLILIRNKNLHLGKMKLPGIVYSFFVGLLFSKGLMITIYSGISPAHLLILTGTFLFLVSDIILLYLNFHVSPPKCLAFLNLSTYYAALAILGLSLYPF